MMSVPEVVGLMATAFASGLWVGARIVPWAVDRWHGWR